MERSELSLNTVFSANLYPIRQSLAALWSHSCSQYTKAVSKSQYAISSTHKTIDSISVRP
jgi:hypothetical protein